MAQTVKPPAKAPGAIRQLVSAIVDRARIAGLLGNTFRDKRNVSDALGYLEVITAPEYRHRYDRGEVAAAIVERMPKACWTGKIEILENDKPTATDFEKKAAALWTRLNLGAEFMRTDVVASLGRYAVLLIGTPGDITQPMQGLKSPDDIKYLSLYGEQDAVVEKWDNDVNSPRYSQPIQYTLKRASINRSGTRSIPSVHHSRVIHVPSDVLDDKIFGSPVLQKVWNRLDDLDKVVGAGSEAFWQRVQQGMHFNADKDVELTPNEQTMFEEHIDEFMHGLRRFTLTRGLDVTTPESSVANFGLQADAILTLISIGIDIPKRLLLGSERGELASTQDRDTFNDAVRSRREQRCEAFVLRPFYDRIIAAGALPAPPAGAYMVRWPRTDSLTMMEKSEAVQRIADANSRRRVIVTENELRDQVFGLDPLDDQELGTDATESRGTVVTAGQPDHVAVTDAADGMQGKVRKAVIGAFKDAATALDMEALEAALEAGDREAAERLLVQAVADASAGFEAALARSLADTLAAGAHAASGGATT